jgi:hypothetical protein
MVLNPRIRVIPFNHAHAATLEVLPAEECVASMPVSNLQNSNRTKSFRITAITEDGFTIKGELTRRIRASAAVLYGHNLRVGDTWRVRLFAGPGSSGDAFETDWMAALKPKLASELDWGIDTLAATPVDNWPGLPHSAAWFGAVATQSFEIDVRSNENPAGFVDINQLFFGEAVSPSRNFKYGYNLSYFDTSQYSLTEGGSTKVDRGLLKRVALSLPRITTEERSTWADFQLNTQQYAELFVSLFPERGGKLERDYAMVCMVRQNGGLQNENAKKFQMNMTLQEI